MSWIRRNWPDLLIVLFILALIAGFVVVLMGGAGSLFGNRNTPSSSATTSTSSSVVETPSNSPTPSAPVQETVPAAPGTEQPFPTPESDASETTSTNSAPVASGTNKPTSPDPSSASGGTAAAAPQAIPIIPAQPNSSTPNSSTPNSSTPNSREPNSSTPEPTPAPPVEVAPVRPAPRPAPVEPPTIRAAPVRPVTPRVVEPAPRVAQPAPRPQPRVNTPRVQASGSGIPTKSDFRISAGLYSNAASAQAVADKISGLGYPVYVLPSKDDTQVVLVGPFGNRGDANTASGDISRVHQNLFVYAPSSESASNQSSDRQSSSSDNSDSNTANSNTSNSNGSTTPVARPQADSGSSTTAGSSYLQVGAYSTQSGADKLVETLRSSGYSPSTRVSSSGLIRVLVGPFSSGELDVAKGKLSSEGVDSFTVRSN
jgi:cell division septation protein DedD